jgi:hypothetical protein
VVGRQQGLPLEHERDSGVAPDKVAEGETHPRVVLTVRGRRRRGAPVADGDRRVNLRHREAKGEVSGSSIAEGEGRTGLTG